MAACCQLLEELDAEEEEEDNKDEEKEGAAYSVLTFLGRFESLHSVVV